MRAILIIIGLLIDLAAGFFAVDRFGRFLDRHLRIFPERPVPGTRQSRSIQDWNEVEDETNWMNYLRKQ